MILRAIEAKTLTDAYISECIKSAMSHIDGCIRVALLNGKYEAEIQMGDIPWKLVKPTLEELGYSVVILYNIKDEMEKSDILVRWDKPKKEKGK